MVISSAVRGKEQAAKQQSQLLKTRSGMRTLWLGHILCCVKRVNNMKLDHAVTLGSSRSKRDVNSLLLTTVSAEY